jgi:uncharacterized MAPEG superfamily protein
VISRAERLRKSWYINPLSLVLHPRTNSIRGKNAALNFRSLFVVFAANVIAIIVIAATLTRFLKITLGKNQR